MRKPDDDMDIHATFSYLMYLWIIQLLCAVFGNLFSFRRVYIFLFNKIKNAECMRTELNRPTTLRSRHVTSSVVVQTVSRTISLDFIRALLNQDLVK